GEARGSGRRESHDAAVGCLLGCALCADPRSVRSRLEPGASAQQELTPHTSFIWGRHMQTIAETTGPSSSGVMLWAGRIISGIVIAFMIFDVGVKLIEMDVVRDNMLRLGFPLHLAGGFQIGVIETLCLILYIVPRTSVLGAILLTAVMGGAIASHLR